MITAFAAVTNSSPALEFSGRFLLVLFAAVAALSKGAPQDEPSPLRLGAKTLVQIAVLHHVPEFKVPANWVPREEPAVVELRIGLKGIISRCECIEPFAEVSAETICAFLRKWTFEMPKLAGVAHPVVGKLFIYLRKGALRRNATGFR